MNAGLFWVCLFVGLEAAQYTVFGNVLQDAEPLRFAAYANGVICIAFIGFAALRARGELSAAFRAPGLLIATNVLVAVAWAAMLGSLRYIEPAISYTIGAAVMPLTVWVMARRGYAQATAPRNMAERAGLLVLAASALVLSIVALSGGAGFVRGGAGAAALGVGLAAFEGAVFTVVIVMARGLDARGVGPSTQFGLRFALFAVLAAAALALREGAPPPRYEGWALAALGALLIAPPLYALQRAIAKAPAMTISIATAFGPFCIFAFQIAEGRFAASALTFIGLTIYSFGALIAAFGAWRAFAGVDVARD